MAEQEVRLTQPTRPTPARSRNMAAVRGRDTAPEMQLRRALHSLGLRYRVDIAPLRGFRRRADIVFTRHRVAVMVDGCFWHGCPLHGSRPATNAAWWADKLDRNVRRDRETDEHLRSAGWTVVRVWEHEPVDEAVAAVLAVLPDRAADARRTSGAPDAEM